MFMKVRAAASCAILAIAMSAPAMAQSASPMAASAKPVQGKIDVKVLSSRFDLVSGGDALVEVKASEGAKASELRLSLNGRDLVTPLKFDQPSNTLRGVVTGLDVGGNWLQVTGPTGYTVSQPLVNHPITGPILSGPHMTPYECRTRESGLGDPTDANCSAPTRYDWFYRSTAPAGGVHSVDTNGRGRWFMPAHSSWSRLQRPSRAGWLRSGGDAKSAGIPALRQNPDSPSATVPAHGWIR